MPSITFENAKEMSAKANQVRWDKWREKQRAKSIPEPAVSIANGNPHPEMREELEIVNEQIAGARKALNDRSDYCEACKRPPLEPHHRAQLMKALDSLLDRKRILLGIPMPGSKRPAPDRPKRDRFTPAPQPIVPSATPGQDPNEPNG